MRKNLIRPFTLSVFVIGLLLGSLWPHTYLLRPAIAQSNDANGMIDPMAPPIRELEMEDAAATEQSDTSLASSLTDAELRTINLFEKASPSIVNISTTARVVNRWTRRAFEVPRGSGTGFFWDNEGHIVTNYHVVQNATSVVVTLQDQRELIARIVGVSPDHDIAVLKVSSIDDISDLPPALPPALPIGKSSTLRVGQQVHAIGNPFGLDHTLTMGIVSALEREIKAISGRTIENVIQTDAAINPGNSGGPLLDSNGRVIGINTAIFNATGSSIGIGFAVPIDTARRVVPMILKTGAYTPPRIGIVSDERWNRWLRQRTKLDGVFVLGVAKNSPAEQAGFVALEKTRQGNWRVGDVITKVDGREITGVDDLYLALDQRNPGDLVKISGVRFGNQSFEVMVKLR